MVAKNLNTTFPNLKNPPIEEAIIGVQLQAKIELGHLTKIKEFFTDCEIKEKRSYSHSINLKSVAKEGGYKFQEYGFEGFLLELKEKNQIIQFLNNSFLFSQRKPYTGWDDFFSSFEYFWKFYAHLVHVTEIEQLGLRYINQVIKEVTAPTMEVYFSANPQMLFASTEKDSYQLDTYLYQENYRLKNTDYQMLITKTKQSLAEAKSSQALDINIFTTNPFLSSFESMSDKLKEMRDLKNQVFSESLTTFAKEEFDK